MQRKKIIILIVILVAAAAAYYFYVRGAAAEQKASEQPEPQIANLDITNLTPPKDPNAGKFISGAKNKDVVNYYLKNPLENPFINPLISPGFIIKRLFKKK
jgi:hypothetical protein